MASAWHRFYLCGGASWACLLVALLGCAFAMVALFMAIMRASASKLLAWIALLLSMVPLAVGALGVSIGKARVDEVVRSGAVAAEQRESLRAVGYDEAGQCVVVGGALSLLPALPAVIAVGLAHLLRRKGV